MIIIHNRNTATVFSNKMKKVFNTALQLNAIDTIKKLKETYKPENKPAIIDIRYWTNGNDGTLGFSVGDEITYGTFVSAGHKLKLNNVKLAPKTDLIIGDWNMFGKTFRIHNGTDEEKSFSFRWYLPVMHSLKVEAGAADGKFYDSYNWFWYIVNVRYLPFILSATLIIVIIVLMAVNGKESYTAPATPTFLSSRNGSMY